MTNARTLICAVALWATAACSSSNDANEAAKAASMQDGGPGQSGSGSAGHGGSGSGGGNASPATGGHSGNSNGSGGAGAKSCEDRADQASEAVRNAITSAGLSCSAKSDCEDISVDTACNASCGALVGPASKKAAEAAIRAQNDGMCKTFAADGCLALIPPCDPPEPDGFDCIAGQCRWKGDMDPGSDAGSQSDAGSSAAGCVDQTIWWGPNGGFALRQDRHTLMPCNDFEFMRTEGQSPGSTVTCANQVAADAAVSIAEVNAQLADADVKAAVSAAAGGPALFGNDSRPVDGSVFRIEIGKAIIDLGDDCASGASGCKMIPAGLSRLRMTLNALTDQQMMLPNCDSVP
jgi:hypothetical protein